MEPKQHSDCANLSKETRLEELNTKFYVSWYIAWCMI